MGNGTVLACEIAGDDLDTLERYALIQRSHDGNRAVNCTAAFAQCVRVGGAVNSCRAALRRKRYHAWSVSLVSQKPWAKSRQRIPLGAKHRARATVQRRIIFGWVWLSLLSKTAVGTNKGVSLDASFVYGMNLRDLRANNI